MRGLPHLALAHARHHAGRTLILTLCLALALLLPAATTTLMDRYERDLTARAEATPLVSGARGNRYDLTLGALYFRRSGVAPVDVALLEWVARAGRGTAVPLHVRFSARGEPIVGTSPEYYELRGLEPQEGHLPAVIGDAALGSAAAERLGLGTGDVLFSDPAQLYDIAQPASIQLAITGVLAPRNTPDDDAVFVDVKTAWVVEGLAHGHGDVAAPGALDEEWILSRSADSLVVSPALIEHGRVTGDNLWDFHTHGDRSDLPLSAVLFFPEDVKAGTLLKADLNTSKIHQAVSPERVVAELMDYAFRIKDLLDVLSLVLISSTLLFCALVLTLTARLRQEEFRTLHAIGCSRGAAWKLIGLELTVISMLACLTAALGLFTLLTLAPDLARVF